MKTGTIILSVTSLLCTIFVTESAMCQSAQIGRNSEATIIVAANTTSSSQLFDRVRYNPSVIYSGQYKTNAIYYRNPGNPVWRAGINKDLNRLACRTAQNSLIKTGLWMGHIKQDGSCGDTAEPIEWAAGNWLNFNAAK